jgi:hypothetical protein
LFNLYKQKLATDYASNIKDKQLEMRNLEALASIKEYELFDLFEKTMTANKVEQIVLKKVLKKQLITIQRNSD